MDITKKLLSEIDNNNGREVIIDKYLLIDYLEELNRFDNIITKTTDALYKEFEEKCCNGCNFAMKCVDEDGSKNYEYSKCFKYYAKENCSNAEKTFLKTKFGWDC